MKVLYTAFKGIYNTSFQLVSRLEQESVFLTNSFQGLKKDLSVVNAQFDTVIMFGVDKKLTNHIRIETCAEYNDEFICTSFNIDALERECKKALIAYSISNKPTGYLCNAAYYHMLKKIPNTVFIHIPSIKWMNDEMMKKLICLF